MKNIGLPIKNLISKANKMKKGDKITNRIKANNLSKADLIN